MRCKTKIFSVLLVIVLCNFGFVFSPVNARIGTIGETFTIYTPGYQQSSEYHDGPTSNHLFHVGDYWYKLQIFWDGSNFGWYWRSAIDSDLTVWSTASSAEFLNTGTYYGSLWDHVDAIYDAAQNVFHCVAFNGVTQIYYKQGTPNATGGITFGDKISVVTTGGYSGNIEVCLMNGKPVIAASSSTTNWPLYVLFASDETGSSWTSTVAYYNVELGWIDVVFPQVHAINTTHVYVIFGHGDGVDAPLYGFYVSESINETSTFTTISSEDIEGSAFSDGSSREMSGFSTISENILNPTSYAEMISILYVNTTKYMKMFFWNVTSESISGDVEVVYAGGGAYFPLTPILAKEGTTYWAGHWDRTSANDCHFTLHERDPGTGIWDDGTIIDYGWWSATRFCPSTMNKQPYNEILIVTLQGSNCYNFGCDVEASGKVWNENVEIDNYEPIIDAPGADRWIFAEWKYYDFSASYGYYNASGDAGDYIETAWLMLTDGWNWFNVSYNPENDSMTLESDNPDVVSLDYGSVSEDGLYLNVTFRLLFYGGTIDALDIDLYMYVEDLDGAFDGPEIMQEDYVNIYVQGGTYEVTPSGNAGHLPGGAWNDLYAFEDSSITSVIYYRNLQHFRLLNSIYVANVTGADFELQYYIEVCKGGGWTNLITLILEGEGGHTGSYRYINFTALFYESGVLDSDATKQVYFFHRAKVGAGDGDPTQTEVWIDGWIDRDNRSTVVGLRANAYYYPMKDEAEVFFRWLSTNWGVDADKRKDVSARYPMYDTDPEELISSKEITMVRIRYVLAVSFGDGGAQTVETTNYQSADYTISPLNQEMEGIQTPPMMETLVPMMPAGGWIGALMSGFRWLGDVLIPGLGGLQIWDQMVDFLDTIAAAFGAPNLFRNILTWFGSFWTWLTTSLGYLLLGITEIFAFLAVTMGKILEIFVSIMRTWIDMASFFVQIMYDGLGTGINIWTDYNISQWIVLAAILYPMWLLFMWDEEGIEPVYRHLTFVRGILEFTFNFFMAIAQFGLNLIGRVIESIPVVE